MTQDEMEEYNRIRLEKKRLQKIQLRRRQNIIRLLIYIIIILIFCVCSFFLGKKAGIRQSVKEVQALAVDGDLTSDINREDVNGMNDANPNEENKTYGIAENTERADVNSGNAQMIQEQTGTDNIGNDSNEIAGERKKEGGTYMENDLRLILVNKSHPLPEDYEVTLITLPDGRSRAAEEAYAPLMEMLAAGEKTGLHFVVCSSYRDAERQRELFEEDVEDLMNQGYSYEEAYEEVAKETMPPGYSEHSTGLAFDIVAADDQMLDAGQEQTAENRWLREHCAEYGFILRYPRGKEDVTLINYESWHFRYVGKAAAEYIMEHGLTLEEYVDRE